MSTLKQFDGNILVERLMEVSGLNQEQLGASLEEYGISKNTISLWHRGLSLPKVDKLYAIARKFNCSIDYLVGISDKNPNDTATRYTARDVCRMLTEIDKQYNFKYLTQTEPLNGNDVEMFCLLFGEEQVELLKDQTRERIFMSLTPHVEKVDGVQGETLNTACLQVSAYLNRYFSYKDSLRNAATEADELKIKDMMNGLLQRVPDELPPC